MLDELAKEIRSAIKDTVKDEMRIHREKDREEELVDADRIIISNEFRYWSHHVADELDRDNAYILEKVKDIIEETRGE